MGVVSTTPMVTHYCSIACAPRKKERYETCGVLYERLWWWCTLQQLNTLSAITVAVAGNLHENFLNCIETNFWKRFSGKRRKGRDVFYSRELH